jgi:hypothetical protein
LFGSPVAAVEAFAKEMALINQAPLLAIRAVMELGLELDEPPATQPATTAITPPTTPAVEPTPDQPKPAIGTGLDWQTARDRLIALRRAGESFTSLRNLAVRVGCSEGLIRKAIKSDVGLRAWTASTSRTRRTAPAATSLDHTIRRTAQRREAAPDIDAADSNAPADDDAVLQRLIEAASPSERNAGIDGLVEAAKAKGETLGRFIAAIEWDSVHAPKSTNLRQLAEIGIHPPAADALGDEDLPAALTLVIDGLAALGVYLSGTDHLADRKLYSVLTTKVLLDEIRDIPPNDDMSEFIDCSSIPPTDRKSTRKRTTPYPAVCNRDSTMPRYI